MPELQESTPQESKPDLIRRLNNSNAMIHEMELLLEPGLRIAFKMEVRSRLKELSEEKALQTMTGPQALRYASTLLC